MDKDTPLLVIFYLLSWRAGSLTNQNAKQALAIVAYTYWNGLEEA